MDYKALNAATMPNHFPIPIVDELLDELHRANVFSRIDLCSEYHQIHLAPEDTFKTAFCTIDGHFEFFVMPFSLTKASSTFEATMHYIFWEHLQNFVLIFFDDILVFSPDRASHLHHRHQVSAFWLQINSLFASPSSNLELRRWPI